MVRMGALVVAFTLTVILGTELGMTAPAAARIVQTEAAAAAEADDLALRAELREEVVDDLGQEPPAAAVPLDGASWAEQPDGTDDELPVDVPAEETGATVMVAQAADGSAKAGAKNTEEPAEADDADLGVTEIGGVEVGVTAADDGSGTDAVDVRIAGQAETKMAGITGLLFDLAPATTTDAAQLDGKSRTLASDDVASVDGEDPGLVEVSVNYSSFAGMAGGEWASRLRIVQIPDCATDELTAADCQPTLVPSSVNDASTTTVSAEVPAVGTFAVTGGVAGPQGNWAATDLSSAAAWSVSGGTGSFSWSYPIRTVQAPAGPAPELEISYSSASIDGRVATTNNQSSWVGDGFDLTSGYVERKYTPCSDDTGANDAGKTPNNAGHETGDLCWGKENATLVFGGGAIELVKDDNDGDPDRELWRPKDDDGTRVERITGSWLSGHEKEAWLVTTLDGTRYWFGRGQRSATDTTKLGSAWTVPVYGNHPTEPCYAAEADGGFAASQCEQVYRWNLEYVQDRSNNSMTYFYDAETNNYLADNGEDLLEYVSGGRLLRIEYGTVAGSEVGAQAPARVVFSASSRCVGGATCLVNQIQEETRHWPDTPADLVCDTTAECGELISPVFFDRTRLSTITTHAFDGSAYQRVDSWKLTQSFIEPGDGSMDEGTPGAFRQGKILWLKKIEHTGHGGTATTADDTAALPTAFDRVHLANRANVQPDDPNPAMWRYRLSSIKTESGAVVSVNYRTECENSTPGPEEDDQENNHALCFPVEWDPEGHVGPEIDYFHKYVVDSVVQNGTPETSAGHLPTGSVPVTTKYTYEGDAVWKKPTGALVKPKEVTYSDFRGYPSITVTTGTGEAATSQRTWYYRGLGGNLSGGPSGHTVTAPDHERFRGQIFGSVITDGSAKVSESWEAQSSPTLTATMGSIKAYSVASSTGHAITYAANGSTVVDHTSVTTTYDEFGQTRQVADQGTAASGDEVCTTITYAADSNAGLADKHLRSLSERTLTASVPCAQMTANPAAADKMADTLASYDSAGRLIKTEVIDPDDGVGRVTESQTTQYDSRGRPVKQVDALNRLTETVFAHSTGGLLQQATVYSPDMDPADGNLTDDRLTTMTGFDPETGLTMWSQDANGRRTTGTYDGLGRLKTVRYPQHADTSAFPTPSIEYDYRVGRNGLNIVTTKTLGADGRSQRISATLHDGLMREFQTQTDSSNAGESRDEGVSSRGRVVTHTFYDEAGRVHETYAPTAVTGTAGSGPVQAPVPDSSTVYTYDQAGRQTASKFFVGTSSNPEYERWRTTTVYDGRTALTIPPMGQTPTATTVDPNGLTVSLRQYDRDPDTNSAADTAAEVKALSSRLSKYEYDPSGRLTGMTDPMGNTWAYEYDWLGRQVGADDPDAGLSETEYDLAGQVTVTKDANGAILQRAYDVLGRQTRLTDGAGAVRASWTYDNSTGPDGRRLYGVTTSSTRYVDQQQYTTTVPTYDLAYQPTATTVTLPATGNLAALPQEQRKYTTTTSYTADGQIEELGLPAAGNLGAEKVTTFYDAASMPEWTTGGFGWGTYVAASRFTAIGQPMMMDLGTTYGAVVGYEYESGTERLAGLSLARERYDNFDLNLRYGYDQSGNITSVTDTPTSAALSLPEYRDLQCYDYDGFHQLATAWTPADNTASEPEPGVEAPECATVPTATNAAGAINGAAPYWAKWTFDDVGNRKAEQHVQLLNGQASTESTAYTYPVAKTRNTGTGAGGPHALGTATTTTTTPAGTETVKTTLTYDDAGSTSTKQTGTSPTQLFGWDPEGELAAIATTGDGTEGESTIEDGEAEFVYTAEGERLVRTDGEGTTVYLPGGQELHVASDGLSTATRYYGFAGQTVAVRTDRGLGGVSSLVCDPHGTPVASVPNTDWGPKSVQKMYTDAYGGARGPSDGDTVPGDMGFLGKNKDESTGLTMVGARYYDEAIGRFISVDPVIAPSDPGQWNAYAYGSNNPVSNADPTGLAHPYIPEHPISQPDKDGGSGGGGSGGGGTNGGGSGTGDPKPGPGSDAPVDSDDWANQFAQGVIDYGGEMVTGIVELAEVEWKYLQQCMESFSKCGDFVKFNAKLFADALNPVNAVKGVIDEAKQIYEMFTDGRVAYASGQLAAMILEKVVTKGAGGAAAVIIKNALKDGCSFEGDTEVLMADGSTEPIESIEVGDEVLATDPETGEQEAKTVEAKHVHDDILVTLVLIGAEGVEQTIRTTEDHPFWSETDREFQRADALSSGELVLDANGETVKVVGIDRDVALAPAWNITVAELHTYHVRTNPDRGPPQNRGAFGQEERSILVHNCPIGASPNSTSGAAASPNAASAPELLDTTIREGSLDKHVKGTNEHATASKSDPMGKSTFTGPASARKLVKMTLERGTPFYDSVGTLRVKWDAGVTTGFAPDGSRRTGVIISYSKKGWHGWPANV